MDGSLSIPSLTGKIEPKPRSAKHTRSEARTHSRETHVESDRYLAGIGVSSRWPTQRWVCRLSALLCPSAAGSCKRWAAFGKSCISHKPSRPDSAGLVPVSRCSCMLQPGSFEGIARYERTAMGGKVAEALCACQVTAAT